MAIPLLKRSREAWVMACEDEGIKGKWWDWGASWIIAGGPMGRWVGGLVLGWKILDRADGGGKEGEVRLQIGILVFLGLLFSAICLVSLYLYETLITLPYLNLTIKHGLSLF